MALTIDSVLKMDKNDIINGLKQARSDMQTQPKYPLTQFFLTANTPDSVIEKLNVAQCIFALTKFCENKQISQMMLI